MEKDKVFFNPIRMLSPKLDKEAARLEELHKAPVSASFSLEEGLVVMLSKIIRMTQLLRDAFARDCPDEMKECQLLAEQVHKQEGLLTAGLVCSAEASPELCGSFMLFPGHLERVGDFLESILRCCKIKCEQHLEYSDKSYAEVQELFELMIEMFTNLRDAIMVPNRPVLEQVIDQETRLEQMCNERQLAHIDRLLRGRIIPKASSPYLDILDSVGSLGRHIREMADKILTFANVAQPAG
jgi:Na+/phosphate symporter